MPETMVLERPAELTDTARAILGAYYDLQNNNVSFRVFSNNATLIRIYFYKDPINSEETLAKNLVKDGPLWEIQFPLDELRNAGITTDYIYYGYRAWGPNWPFLDYWQKGSEAGFHQDVDSEGNRFNPNKLLIDPYADEISHDPQIAKLYMDPPLCMYLFRLTGFYRPSW